MMTPVLNQMTKILKSLFPILDKAAAYADGKKFDVEVLLNSRLAPDQFNFIRQIQIACDSAKFTAARLANKEKEAPAFPDNEKTLSELRTRIENTIDYLKTFKESDFHNIEAIKISLPRWEGKHMFGDEYLHSYALPNFYFHITTAYSILRHNGVDLGKKDFLGGLPYRN